MIVASIDIGTNTILLLIAEVNGFSKEIKVLYNMHSIPRIGKGLKSNNPIPEENITRMLDVLDDYDVMIKKINCEKVLLTGTNAFRISSNQNEIAKEINTRYGYELYIITGDEEARLSYLGAVNGLSEKKNNLVIDIGGGSTEIIYGKGSKIKFRKSFPIGVVSGTENYLTSDPPEQEQVEKFVEYIQKIFSELIGKIDKIDSAIAIAGTPTTLAAIKHNLKSYDEDVVEGSPLSLKELEEFIAKLSNLDSGEILKRYSQIVKGREDVLLAGTLILKEILVILNIDKVKVSTKGIRYGAIINWLNSL